MNAARGGVIAALLFTLVVTAPRAAAAQQTPVHEVRIVSRAVSIFHGKNRHQPFY